MAINSINLLGANMYATARDEIGTVIEQNGFKINLLFQDGTNAFFDYRFTYGTLLSFANKDEKLSEALRKNINEFKSEEISKKAARVREIEFRGEVLRSSNRLCFDFAKIEELTELITGFNLGKRASEIYDTCCEKFDFDTGKHSCFTQNQVLFAENAAPGNRAVWFIAHSNWNQGAFTSYDGKYINTIVNDCIIEKWLIPVDSSHYVGEERVIFAKNKSGYYEFSGVYRCELVDLEKSEFRYRRISDTYSMTDRCSMDEKAA